MSGLAPGMGLMAEPKGWAGAEAPWARSMRWMKASVARLVPSRPKHQVGSADPGKAISMRRPRRRARSQAAMSRLAMGISIRRRSMCGSRRSRRERECWCRAGSVRCGRGSKGAGDGRAPSRRHGRHARRRWRRSWPKRGCRRQAPVRRRRPGARSPQGSERRRGRTRTGRRQRRGCRRRERLRGRFGGWSRQGTRRGWGADAPPAGPGDIARGVVDGDGTFLGTPNISRNGWLRLPDLL